MAGTSSAGVPMLSERVDIHKSCKSLETLVNVLVDYCEAAGAIVSLQKKLAKALRDTAALKVTGEIASNAMNASANIFEVLADIDSKFAKFAEKESDGISTEVRKWFKKLTKEEKAHDERLTSANARIKQAGQVYEKKSKRNARDAGEEHARYINLISTVGPEISQEKYNHALLVTQRQISTNYSVAACVSRVADAQWLRTCEGVRRFSPSVGSLGEWRALCEGGWTGPIPKDLPNADDQEQSPADQVHPNSPQPAGDRESPTDLMKVGTTTSEEKPSDARPPPTRQSTRQSGEYVDEFGSSRPMESRNKKINIPPPAGLSPSSSSSGPSSTLDQPKLSSEIRDSFGTLSVFPSPPSHFPIPPMAGPPDSQWQERPQFQSQSPQTRTQTPLVSHGGVTALSRVAESSQNSDLVSPQTHSTSEGSESRDDPPSPLRSDNNNPSHARDDRRLTRTKSTELSTPFLNRKPSLTMLPENARRKLPTPPPQLSMSTTDPQYQKTAPGFSAAYDRRRTLEDESEFGVRNSAYGQYQSRIADTPRSTTTERRDSATSSGSIVAAMRNRFSHNSGMNSPSPRDVPRIPLSVTDLASRYQPSDAPLSPRRRAGSPPVDQQLRQLDTIAQTQMSDSYDPDGSSPSYTAGRYSSSPTGEDDWARRQQHQIEDQTELELREREREIERKARELERDRARLATIRSVRDGDVESMQQHQWPSAEQPYQKVDFPSPRSPYSRSNTHLVPPSSPQQVQRQRQPSSPTRAGDHAEFCGCDSCSVAKYKVPSSPSVSAHDLRPPEKPINLRPDKPKGNWIRRLSMPAGLSLDSKRTASSNNLRIPAQEDGRIDRRSFEASGIGYRSVTNLARR